MRRYGSIVVQRRRCFIFLYSICEKKMLFAGGINKCINFTIIQCRSARSACDRIMYSTLRNWKGIPYCDKLCVFKYNLTIS